MRANLVAVHVIRLDTGDEVISALSRRLEEFGVRGAAIMGIGGISKARVGVFDPSAGVYRERIVEGFHEVVSLMGNASVKEDGSIFPHLHVSLASESSLVAGHLLEAVVEPTLEVFVFALDSEVRRTLKTPYGFVALDV